MNNSLIYEGMKLAVHLNKRVHIYCPAARKYPPYDRIVE
jgi:hypothetical protein